MVENMDISFELVNEILDALKDEKEHYLSKWKEVGRHPASRYKREYLYFSELVSKLEDAIIL